MNNYLAPQFLITLNTFLDAHPEILLLITFWTLIWKGLALWKSAQHKEKTWFIVLLILNTVGLLDILYLFVFSKNKKILPLIKKEENKKEKDEEATIEEEIN